jgi:hypothetical protein
MPSMPLRSHTKSLIFWPANALILFLRTSFVNRLMVIRERIGTKVDL